MDRALSAPAAAARPHRSIPADHPIAVATGLGVLASLPSLLWGVAGADYISDDYPVAAAFENDGIIEASISLALDSPARLLVAPYYVVTYVVIGPHPFAQAVLLGALNALVAGLLYLVLREVVRPNSALFAALAFAVIPNRSSTRLWFVLGPNVLALALVLVVALQLSRDRRPRWLVPLLPAAVLLYEGVALLGLAVVVLWYLQERHRRLRTAFLLAAPLVAATALTWAISPKHGPDRPDSLSALETSVHGLIGEGLWGSAALGVLGAAVLFAAAAMACVRTLPSFRSDHPGWREIRLGSGLAVAGAAPAIVGGAPFAVSGVFDRNNLVAGVGVCIVLAAVLAAPLAAADRRARVGGAVLSAIVVGWLSWASVEDVRHYRDAVVEGQALVDQLHRDLDPTIGTVLVTPLLEGEAGVAQFILGGDLTNAMVLEHGASWQSVHMTPARGCGPIVDAARERGDSLFVYERLTGVLRAVDAEAACDS